ncbi:hypothetical protein PLICRDRAFT_139470 [Plicaturopsis crispa FD-325 SS-3]|nr:hypothetical protein PLICRDRAFT_139470 [Plicaturopsis crispa FD-325 SS-3]
MLTVPRVFIRTCTQCRNIESLMAKTRRASRVERDGEFEPDPRPGKRTKPNPTSGESAQAQSPRKKGKSREDPKPEDYSPRTSSLWKVGLHVTAKGGVENTIANAAALGANAFALFLKSQRKWTSKPLDDDSISLFKARMKEFGYSPSHILPHGSYLINLGNPDVDKREKSYTCFLDDLQRCEQLGLELYNFHPGSTVGDTTSEHSITLIADSINRAHRETKSVITVLENMAGSGNVVGSAFVDLANIIRQVEDKNRVAVCLDTCHMFAAVSDNCRMHRRRHLHLSRDMTSEQKRDGISDFDTQVGLAYLRGIHMNDSKTLLGSRKDRHENIGLGHLGISAFHHILMDPRMQNLPLILETPGFDTTDVAKKEIEVSNRLSQTSAVDGHDQWVEEIREAVKMAGGGQKKPAKKSRKATSRKADDQAEEESCSD